MVINSSVNKIPSPAHERKTNHVLPMDYLRPMQPCTFTAVKMNIHDRQLPRTVLAGPSESVGEKIIFRCHVCCLFSTNLYDCLQHSRLHIGEQPFKCEHCKIFKHKQNLKCHQRKHTVDKPSVCEYCGKGFTSTSNFSRHLRTHTGEKPFMCTHCGKCFSQSSSLSRHARVHTGEKPFKCTHCEKWFGDASTRNRHQRTHGEKLNDHTDRKEH